MGEGKTSHSVIEILAEQLAEYILRCEMLERALERLEVVVPAEHAAAIRELLDSQ